MYNLIDEFNRFFENDAQAELNGDRLEITVGSRTLSIELPRVVGGSCKPTLLSEHQ